MRSGFPVLFRYEGAVWITVGAVCEGHSVGRVGRVHERNPEYEQ